ncbi:hypothetical protein OGAPHI_001721 [Ogataea philodendri]|uniref:Transmembrane protein n=1 Tax=Ogataea philodendri TaxID=1378263 RepID=A0A9P8P9P0_9ASCO|nr:uncharacterized protein OGAPHI_001721 [Ogataea philodendri]KAH3667967.1 hypothetical protein OGAPHI_001721 [Ogataea philodendri]
MDAKSMFLSKRIRTNLSELECWDAEETLCLVFITWSLSFWSSLWDISSAGPPLLDLMIGTDPIVSTEANKPFAILSAIVVICVSVVFGLLNCE